jgi:hypothetical protein
VNDSHVVIEYLIEIACNQMLGNYQDEPWGGIVKMDKTFELKVCELRLVDPKMEEYYFDLLALRDASKVMEDQE